MKNVFALDKKLWCEIHKTPYCPDFLCKEFWGCKTVEAERRAKLRKIEENKKKYKHPTMTEAVNKHDFFKMCGANFNEMIKKLLKDSLIKKIVKELNEKEVRKMSRPYFETEVVKVKKERKCKHNYGVFRCYECGKMLEKYVPSDTMSIKKKPKGNWLDGENLDKIKFPCFCSFIEDGKKYYGEINLNYNEHKEKPDK